MDYFNMEVMRYWSYPKSFKGDINKKTKSLVESGQYIGAKKIDGEHARFIKQNGQVGLLSRSRGVDGAFANKITKVPHLQSFLCDIVPDNSILVGELFLPNETNSGLVGSVMRCLDKKAIQRQIGNPICFYIFDVWAWNGEELFDIGIEQRMKKLNTLKEILQNENIHFAKYYEGEELWDKIGLWLENGEEGAVITKKTCPVYQKRTPAYETIKIKKELLKDIDVFFTGQAKPPLRDYTGKYKQTWGYWQNEITGEFLSLEPHYKEYVEGAPITPVTKGWYYSIPGSFEIGVYRGEKVYPLGYLSGVTDDLKADFLANPKKYILRPIEVSAMEIGNAGGLRHPKFVRLRDDIDALDCTFEKIFGYE